MSLHDRIKHFIVLMLENRSYDHMLGDLSGPGLVGTPQNWRLPYHEGTQLRETDLRAGTPPDVLVVDPPHSFEATAKQICGTPDVPNMAGFAKTFLEKIAHRSPAKRREHLGIYTTHYAEGKLPVLHELARRYGVCTHWFSSMPGPTGPNRMFAHAGTSFGAIDNRPSLSRMANDTIFDALGDDVRAWRVYYHDVPHLWLTGDDWVEASGRHFFGINRFENDVITDQLATYTFIEPRHVIPPWNSQHPSALSRTSLGEKLIARVYNALASNAAVFAKSLLLIVYDEHGGFADHVIPPGWEGWRSPNPWGDAAAPNDYQVVAPDDKVQKFAFDRLGPRVPAVVISPWIAPGSVFGWGASSPDARLTFDHTSILKTIEEMTGRRVTSARARAATSLGAVLNMDAARELGNLGAAYSRTVSPVAEEGGTQTPEQQIPVGIGEDLLEAWSAHDASHADPSAQALVRHFQRLVE